MLTNLIQNGPEVFPEAFVDKYYEKPSEPRKDQKKEKKKKQDEHVVDNDNFETCDVRFNRQYLNNVLTPYASVVSNGKFGDDF